MSQTDSQTATPLLQSLPRTLATAIRDTLQLYTDHPSSREREQLVATLAQISPVGIFRADADGQVTYVNDRWCEITGMTLEQAQGNWSQAVHSEDWEQVMAAWTKSTQTRQPFRQEYRVHRADDTVIWVLGQAIVETDEQDQVVGYVGTITDITDRKQVELALQERATELTYVNTMLARTTALLKKRNQELDQFAYVASHDLKAPLRAIANLSEWLEEDLDELLPTESRHQMQLLRGRVHRMEALINGLLEYSRIGRLEAEIEPVDVNALLMEVIDSLALPPTFTIIVGKNMPTLKTKRLLLGQVFANLISNAVKHHPHDHGQVTISVQSQGGHYEFAVSDDGNGIAPEYHNKIFTIFQTLEARDTKESTGIGLSIVKKIIETEGGSITVDSQVGAGATFRFTWHP
ncbi:sensor histidine kinase [Pantanalinema sp. GBBB05]|uniref:sensor histidine kinase n=1 Tax=Pantanalinema sp. GBBB05 TaxID=2604139 RepID=UPI001D64F45F|nr:PAS domain S-box protein [Pantanalinema sp. GBBB05]